MLANNRNFEKKVFFTSRINHISWGHFYVIYINIKYIIINYIY